MLEHQIPYGTETVSLKLPDTIPVRHLFGKHMPALADLSRTLHATLDSPAGVRPLKDLAYQKRSATIVVGDPSHYNAYEVWLPTVLNELNSRGIKDDKIQLYLASGTQGALSEDQKKRTFGGEIMRRVKLLDHDADNRDRMERVGKTTKGTLLFIDKRILDTDLLLTIGGVQYHYFSGYTGGPKAIMPGCAGRESILQNSKYAMDTKTGDIHPWVGPGILVGNPVSEDMHQCCTVVKPDMTINVVINGNRQIAAIHAGAYDLALRNCAKFLDEHYRVDAMPATVAIIGAGGAPKDATLFQAYKSLRHCVGALASGASVVWLAKCADGEGGDEMATHRAMTTEEIRDQLKKDPAPVTFCTLMMRKIAQTYDVHLVSDLPPEVAQGWKFTPHNDINGALAAVARKKPGQQQWMIGTDLSYLLPVRPGSDPREGRH
jgi:nickel-dependent lactate racemase